MNQRIQLSFPELSDGGVHKASQILQGLRDRGYKWLGHFDDPELPIKPGQYYTCKIERLYAIVNTKTEEVTLTAEDMELLSSVTV